MKKFKGAVVVTLAAALMLSAAGCGKSGDDKKSDNTATKSDASGSDADADDSTTEYVDDGDWTTTEAQIVEDERFATVEGVDVIGLTFDDDKLGGFTSYSNGGKYTLLAENGQMVCDIQSHGSLEHSCQAYYDGFTMARGCVYTISFDVSCDVPRSIEWRVQLNGGDYHAYASDYVEVGPETKTVTCEFTMEENSDPAPRLVFNMGTINNMTPVEGEHKIYFDNISLFVTDSSNAEQIVGTPTPIQVKVNQLGYAPDDKKTIVVTSGDDYKFKIVNVDTDETVYVGPLSDKKSDTSVNCDVRTGDFSSVKAPGKYKAVSCPSGESYEFEIGDDLYDDVYRDVVLMLYNQRCGVELDNAISGDFAHEACHTGEALIYGDDSGTKVDVSGGWHDAGDYGRYVVSGAKTVQDLLLAYEDFGYDADDIGIPESGNGVSDLLDEVRFELDWMLKMQDKDSGGVYHKVTGLVFPETVLAVEETEQLYLAPISYAATGDFAAVMAKASIIYADIDKEFADRCLDASKKAFSYMEAEGSSIFHNPEEIVTGEYVDGRLEDERMWAAAELYIATGDSLYKDVVNELMEERFARGLGWANVGYYPMYDLARADGIDDSIKAAAKDNILEKADGLMESCEASAFGISLSTSFPWGSNMNIANDGMMFLFAYNMTGDEKYLDYAKKQRDYLFGVNGVGYCFVTGYGTLSPTGTHHRPSQVLDKTMPGMLVGGPDNALEDPYANAVLYGYAPALSYVDNEQSFSCNEVTVYWNSPLIYLLTGINN